LWLSSPLIAVQLAGSSIGFRILSHYRISPADDGSFILLLFGAFFSLYGAVTAGMALIAARDAAHRDDAT
jgi:hypothetical protein